ncbi:MAG: hypothetical protein ACQXXF_07540 [Thermoplasmatota archaeon]
MGAGKQNMLIIPFNSRGYDNPPNAFTFWIGMAEWGNTVNLNRYKFGKDVILSRIHCYSRTYSPYGSSEPCTVYIRVSDTTDYFLGNVYYNEGLIEYLFEPNIRISKDDFFNIKFITPNWVTKPVAIWFYGHMILFY